MHQAAAAVSGGGLAAARRRGRRGDQRGRLGGSARRSRRRRQGDVRRPATGYSVFTSLAHRARGKCCGSGCRHCAFDHVNVRRDRAKKISRPAWLLAPAPDVASAAVLFWSGGKDSFLALRKLLADESEPEIILLTTFDASRTTRRAPGRRHRVDRAPGGTFGLAAARRAARPRVGRGLRGFDIAEGLAAIRRHVAIERLCFGDLHLEQPHIRLAGGRRPCPVSARTSTFRSGTPIMRTSCRSARVGRALRRVRHDGRRGRGRPALRRV